jgi:hypothetical protein
LFQSVSVYFKVSSSFGKNSALSLKTITEMNYVSDFMKILLQRLFNYHYHKPDKICGIFPIAKNEKNNKEEHRTDKTLCQTMS